jgi:hypothetical protein
MNILPKPVHFTVWPYGRRYTLALWRCVTRKGRCGFWRSLRVTLRAGEKMELARVVKAGAAYGS